MRFHRAVGILLFLFTSLCSFGQVIWKDPPPENIDLWKWGPGGKQSAPRPPFEFVKEKLSGTSPKIIVRDAAGRVWTAKFGAEVYGDTFAARLVSALGYAAEPTFFVRNGTIKGVHGLKRAKYFISRNGVFRCGSFKLHQRGAGPMDERTWSWKDNPFVGSRQLAGLKILVMLMSNWDTKDGRDGRASNNKIIQTFSNDGATAWLAVTDWGASLGRSGSFLARDRWDVRGYAAQTPSFVEVNSKAQIHWAFKGKHGQDITAGVSQRDIRWLIPYLNRITDEELEAGLEASGAAPSVAVEYTELIRERIGELQRIADSQTTLQAAK